MFRDSLQKRLQEMERENPSPSLETAKPTLKERVGFWGRYLSRAVEQVPQGSSIYGSVEDKINDISVRMDYDEIIGQAREFLDFAMKGARTGELKSNVETRIRLANQYAQKAGISIDPIYATLASEVYEECMPTMGARKAREFLDFAMNGVRTGELKSDVETRIRLANQYAQEAGISINPDESEKILEEYKTGIQIYGPKKAKEFLEFAAKGIEQGVDSSDIQARIRLAKSYATEAGKPF
jgi:hypothetical protein